MAAGYSFSLPRQSLSVLALIFLRCCCCSAIDDDRQVYIAYMGAIPDNQDYELSSHHLDILRDVVASDDSSIENLLVRSYKRSFNGFAAKLTEAEKGKLSGMNGVVSIFPSKEYKLLTTRSWDFLGMNTTVQRNPSRESDIVIGLIDSGIWPESKSFSDEGMGPPSKTWKGACKGGRNFTCNNKLIGARFYIDNTARDEDGHGTHTASTAAGRIVEGESFFGLAEGVARGGVPSSRIAAYKVCTAVGCRGDAILAAFDDAIADGVDILSLSLGSDYAEAFHSDPLAIGAFHAMERGILTVNSAGNDGPVPASVVSVAPWMLTVAATTTDRRLIDKVVTGKNEIIVGYSINSFQLRNRMYPLIHASNASSDCSDLGASSCDPDCLDAALVKGKILLCDTFQRDVDVQSTGAVGVITTSRNVNISRVEPLPLAALKSEHYDKLVSYVTSTENPKGTILKSEAITDPEAPQVASFSSRGPNVIAEDILKPDLTAPGVAILAAYSPIAPLSYEDKRSVNYSFLSGTSMSCPHVAGIAGYVKSMHPDWSPSAIHSALMTTASAMSASDDSQNEFAYGSGHVNPLRAIDPGLVYEASKADYILMLCGLNYTATMIVSISGTQARCPKALDASAVRNLNYPSLTAGVLGNKPFELTFNRTATNVGSRDSTYKASVISRDTRVKITVVPKILDFKALNEKKSFTVTAVGQLSSLVSSDLVWSDGKHDVRSPIVLYPLSFD